MSHPTRTTWSLIVVDCECRFRHKVRLPNAREWRLHHVEARLSHLSYERGEVGHWHTGSDLTGDFVGVWGFACAPQAAALRHWADTCGIDWSIDPDNQVGRPPWPYRLETCPSRETLHSVASRGFPLGIECKACSHRARLPLPTVGARPGNMKRVRDLRLKCVVCGSREWKHTLFNKPEEIVGFLGPTGTATPAF